MAARSTMAALIAQIRLMINDPTGATPAFSDQQIQDRLDGTRNDIRYELLKMAPTYVNVTTNGLTSSQTIYSDYYSRFGYWEADVVIQGYVNGQFWAVTTPVVSDLIVGHWQFEGDVFNAPSVPGQIPPLFATGKVYDIYRVAADLLEFWAAISVTSYDVTTDGQTFKRSQIIAQRMQMAALYRRQSMPRTVKMGRNDLTRPHTGESVRLLDDDSPLKGGY